MRGSKFELMKIWILLWNVRGANNKEKRKVIKASLKIHKVNFMCL